MKPHERLRAVRKDRGLTLAAVASKVGGKTDASVIHRLEKGTIEIDIEWAEKLGEALECPPDEFLPITTGRRKTVPLVGYVGAGELYYPDPEAGAWMGFDEVEAPPDGQGVVAVRVRGDSMAPVYRSGDLIYFRRDGADLASLLEHDCIVQVRGGPAYIKKLVKGSKAGRFSLESYARGIPQLVDQEIEWAAPVLFIKRFF